MSTAIVLVALLGALVFLLGAHVTYRRTKATEQFPTDPADRLLVAIRAHGNASEYVPLLAVLILVLGLRDAPAWMLWAAAAVVAARYAHAIGVLTSASLARPNLLREIGAGGTCIGGLVLAAGVLVVA